MLRNFLTVAFRNFLRQRLYSLINVLGLASGLVCTLFIYLWVSDELNKDKFHADSDKIFHVVSNLNFGDGNIITWTITPGPLGEDIRDNDPEVEFAARTQRAGSQLFQYDEKAFMESGLYADPDLFKIFSIHVIKGTPSTDPTDIKSVSISKTLASKLFGDSDPIGKAVKLNKRTDMNVVAVFDDISDASSVKFDYVLPFEIFKKNRGDGFNWGNYDHPLYLKLHDASQAEALGKKITDRRRKANADSPEFYLQRFSDYYLNSQYENGRPVGGRIKYVRIFSIVAVFILVIACINFMNMATAKAASRSKEVGIRKVVGAQRRSLVVQFLSESMLISCVAMLLAIGVVFTLLPLLNAIVSKTIAIDFSDPTFLSAVVSIVILTGLLAGSYPAFFLSRYQPALVLKGTALRFSGAALRKSLVVFQFMITVVLIASALVVYRQITFIMNKNIGYEREGVLMFGLRDNLFQEFSAFKNELSQIPSIKKVARGDQTLVQVNNQNSSVGWPGKPDNSTVFFRTVNVDYDFLEALGLKLTQGRMFSKEFNDTSNFVITQRAADVMGFKDPIGQTISQWGINGKIVGVVEDFHSRSLHDAVDPVIFFLRPQWAGWGFVSFDTEHTKESLAEVERVFKKYLPEYPFTYTFLDDDFAKLYRTEQVTGSLALGFTFMAVIISALGLLGLAAYTAEKRKKEISIRKTLGASVRSIVSMMSKEFVTLSIIATLVGCPIAYLLMEKFLSGYAYHTELRWETFALTALAIMVMSALTVIYQVTKAAIANPVDSLRNE